MKSRSLSSVRSPLAAALKPALDLKAEPPRNAARAPSAEMKAQVAYTLAAPQ
ncbi:MAG: hypothetical protein IPL79_13275 [Myxococcales bacterium]|nr:hypothetical protein [Myxococcales bacterium]